MQRNKRTSRSFRQLALALIWIEIVMTNSEESHTALQQMCDVRSDKTPRSTYFSASLTPASNDNFLCFDQYIFERAVMRELSGDVDF